MKAIRVSSDSIQELLDCPEVLEITKCVDSSLKEKICIKVKSVEYYIPEGYYLIKDERDRWSVVTPELYAKIKQKHY